MNNFEELHHNGKINEYFLNKLNNGYWNLLGESLESYLQDAIRMSSLGISSAEEQGIYFRILLDVPDIYEEINNGKYSADDIEKISDFVFLNRDKYPIDSIFNLFCAVANAARNLNIPIKEREEIENCELKSVAYPINPGSNYIQPSYDINKWVHATKDIYNRMFKENTSFKSAEEEVTKNWDKMEKIDYKHWLRFYNEGVPSKYPKLAMKTAQFPMELLKADLPRPVQLQPFREEPAERKVDVNDARTKIETQRLKIINRLNAAEKLLCSLDGQMFAGSDQEFMLKLLQDLKRKVQTANKISIKSTLFEDYIYRTGNYLSSIGKENGAKFFKKIAQDALEPLIPEAPADATSPVDVPPETPPEVPPEAPAEGGDTVPMPGDAAAPIAPAGSPPPPISGGGGSLPPPPAMPPLPDAGMAPEPMQDTTQYMGEQQVYEEDPVKVETQQAIREFFERIDDGVYNPDDDPDEKVKSASLEDADIVVTAQMAGPPIMDEEEDIPIAPAEVAPPEDRPRQHRPKMQPGQEELVVEEDELDAEIDEDNTDDVIDAALNNITIEDAIKRLEMLVSIYKKREISRQLSILDIMMDRLGLGSFFPSLGEAMAKSLEANQYISTRIEDVLNKLKGSADSVSATEWVEGTDEHLSPHSKAVKQKLTQEKDKEEQKKEMRKQREEERLAGKPAPSGVGQQAPEELSQPAQVQTQQPLVTR